MRKYNEKSVKFVEEGLISLGCKEIIIKENIIDIYKQLSQDVEFTELINYDRTEEKDISVSEIVLFTNFYIGLYNDEWLAINLPELNGQDDFCDIGIIYKFDKKPKVGDIACVYFLDIQREIIYQKQDQNCLKCGKDFHFCEMKFDIDGEIKTDDMTVSSITRMLNVTSSETPICSDCYKEFIDNLEEED